MLVVRYNARALVHTRTKPLPVAQIPLSLAVFGPPGERENMKKRFRFYRPRHELAIHASQRAIGEATVSASSAAAANRRRRLLVPDGDQRQFDAVLAALQSGHDAGARGTSTFLTFYLI